MITLPADAPVVVVDDNALDRRVVAAVLERSELINEAVFLDDGDSAIAYMHCVARGERALPALILLDVNMPGTTGFDVLERLRSMPAFARVPIVSMLTSSDAEVDRKRALALGADDYLPKPTGLVAFVDAINARFANAASPGHVPG